MKQTELDKRLYSYYLDKPELLVEVGEWRVDFECKNCGLIVPKTDPCLTNSGGEYKEHFFYKKHGCPHCFVYNVNKETTNYIWFNPIKTNLVTRRFCTTKLIKKKGLFGKEKIVDREGFWEYLNKDEN